MTDFYDTVYNGIKLQAKGIPDTLRAVDSREKDVIRSKRVVFMGCGDSYAVADYGKWAFVPLGATASSMSPSELTRVPLDDSCVVVGITASGRSLETIAALEHAKKSQAVTVVLTDNPRGAACELADHIWLTKSGVPTYNTSPSSPTTTAMAYLLKLAVLEQDNPRTGIYQDSLRLEEDMGQIVTWAESAGKEISLMPRPGETVYLISDGPNYVAAEIGMMKFNEYSLVRGVCVLREEFRHHTTLALRNEDSAILITDSHSDKRDQTYEKVLTETLRTRTHHLCTPTDLSLESSMGQTIANTIALQMAAFHFAKEHNPEKDGFRMPHADAFKIY
jgi:glucosamine--fructose-6-phosphate aminotransferase (isomerizing)